jgi:hypothetical protein
MGIIHELTTKGKEPQGWQVFDCAPSLFEKSVSGNLGPDKPIETAVFPERAY